MSHADERTRSFPVDQLDQPDGLVAPALVGNVEGSATPLVADRLYQFAALTAGIFLLATML
jgi:hypothetical protein